MTTADASLVRQRIDYVDLPDGAVKAILTVSLPGGVVKRFEAVTSQAEAEAVEGDIVAGELALSGPEVGNIFKAVGKLAKKVASSKVFKAAAAGLAMAAPILGPLAPAALAASAGMGVASKLTSAGVAAAKGAKGVARALTAAAASDAKKLTTTPQGAAQLLQVANAKRLGVERIADASPTTKPARAPARAPQSTAAAAPTAYPPRSEADLLARARAGRVRSNVNEPVDAATLLRAHREGRIFWVS